MERDDGPTLKPRRIGVGAWKAGEDGGTLVRLFIDDEPSWHLDVLLNDQLLEALACELSFRLPASDGS